MPQVSVAQLFEDNADALKLAWISGPRNGSPFLDSSEINQASQGLIGHLTWVHPNGSRFQPYRSSLFRFPQ
jgi:HPr kinase/phosphorylase